MSKLPSTDPDYDDMGGEYDVSPTGDGPGKGDDDPILIAFRGDDFDVEQAIEERQEEIRASMTPEELREAAEIAGDEEE
jgi:hypothetical protein